MIDFKVNIFYLLINICDLLIKMWSNLIKNRLIVIEKISIQFDRIQFHHQIFESDRNQYSDFDGLESELSMIRFRSPNRLSLNYTITTSK